MKPLRPFWRYYGGKWRAAPRYPQPVFSTIIEPFAGAAGYSCRYPERNVILVEKYPVIAELWRYLIAVSPIEIHRIPEVRCVDDLPAWVPVPARSLVGWWLNNASVSPCKNLSAGRIKLAAMGRNFEGWTDATKNRIASQVERIRHWRVIEGDYTDAPCTAATYFVDPPYNNKAGSYYVHSAINYDALGQWCQALPGQVIACENEGATWLPFMPFAEIKAGPARKVSAEAIWHKDPF